MYVVYYCETPFINKNNRHPVCPIPSGATLSLTGKTEDSPGPAPAPEPELLPSDLSSDWPTGREGGMVNMKVQGMEGRRGSNNKNHTQGLVAHKNVWSHRAHRRNPTSMHTCVWAKQAWPYNKRAQIPCRTAKYTSMTGLHKYWTYHLKQNPFSHKKQNKTYVTKAYLQLKGNS